MAKHQKRGAKRLEGIPTWTCLSPENRKALEEIAIKEHRTLSQQIAHSLSEWLEADRRREDRARTDG